jgi:hypothetical protein
MFVRVREPSRGSRILPTIKSDQLADGENHPGRQRGLTMPAINQRHELGRHKRSDSNPQLRPEVPNTDQQESSEPFPVGSGIFATATLVGISVIAAELLVIATPSIGFVATFAFLVLGALLAPCMLATAMERIFGSKE